MSVVMEGVGTGILAHIRDYASDTFATLFGGSGSPMKISYGKRPEIHRGINRIFVRPVKMIPQRRIATSGRSAFLYRIRCTAYDGLDPDVTQSIIETGLDARLRAGNPNYATLAAALLSAGGADILGKGIMVHASEAEVTDFDDQDSDVAQSGDPARIIVAWDVSVSLDHVVPLSQA